ncbi:MAG TPA: NAD(P)-dependent oxidoreductase [Chryseolinea sp.]|nr:NAD(P)-dependent oxidoreductase [Chryseolinea sp.]
MLTIALIRESKVPADRRVAFTPAQCKWIHSKYPNLRIVVESSPNRCYTDREYSIAGVEVKQDVRDSDIFMGIKEVEINRLNEGKTYLCFSHTKKKQGYNRDMFRTILSKKITLIDYECMEHADGQRILGFGFFAGIVGAHNGMMAFGKRTGAYTMGRVYEQKNFRELIHNYFGLKLPPLKIAITGSGRVAHGILEIMNLLEVVEVDPDEYLERGFAYPVFTQLKGADLYQPRKGGPYHRDHFHNHPEEFSCLFHPYTKVTDILMNGVYWDDHVPRLFENSELRAPSFSIQTIADITDDKNGSVPCNLGDSSIDHPVYGVDKISVVKTAPYLPFSVDVMAVGNLPNELPRDASRYFGEQLIKHVLQDLVGKGSDVITRATMINKGKLTSPFEYLREYGVEE